MGIWISQAALENFTLPKLCDAKWVFPSSLKTLHYPGENLQTCLEHCRTLQREAVSSLLSKKGHLMSIPKGIWRWQECGRKSCVFASRGFPCSEPVVGSDWHFGTELCFACKYFVSLLCFVSSCNGANWSIRFLVLAMASCEWKSVCIACQRALGCDPLGCRFEIHWNVLVNLVFSTCSKDEIIAVE